MLTRIRVLLQTENNLVKVKVAKEIPSQKVAKTIIGQLARGTPQPHHTTKNVEFVFARNIDGRLYRRTEMLSKREPPGLPPYPVRDLNSQHLLSTAVLLIITETPLVLLKNNVTDPRTSLTYVMA